MKYGDRVRVKEGIFKGFEGELLRIGNADFYKNGKLSTATLAYIQLNDLNQVFVDIDDIKEIDDFPKEFIKVDNINSISISSNRQDWNKAIEDYKKNNNRDVIFLNTYNYSDDDEETAHMFTSLSVPQAKFLVENLNKIIEYIENKSK